MAQMDMKKLDSGDLFPTMEMKLTDNTTLVLPDALKDAWAVLLIYRGRW
jgi:peroxiredoxin